MHPALFAFFTGLHLAILQFCYFFLLLINITSTYITYAAVVLSWMLGTLIGLMWRGLHVVPLLLAGVLSYYAIYFLVVSDPLSPHTFPLAVAGVAITGLWAGRFFLTLLPYFARADKLFLHENNGFLLGVVAVFLGFTTLGSAFLLWTPLVSGLVLALYLLFLLRRQVEPGGSVGPVSEVADGNRAATLVSAGMRQTRSAIAVIVALNLLLPVSLLVHAGLTGVSYAGLFEGEDSAMTWFTTLQLLLVALAAYANYAVAGLLRQIDGAASASRSWVWLLFALGFAFLAVDERFGVLETLRDSILMPADLFVDSPWLQAGDLGLLLYLGFGLILTTAALSELRRCPPALPLTLAALALSAIVIIIDGLSEDIIGQLPGARIWQSVFGEVGTLWAGFLFLCVFAATWMSRLERLLNVTEERVAPNGEYSVRDGEAHQLAPTEREVTADT